MPTEKEIDEHLSERSHKYVSRFGKECYNIGAKDSKYFDWEKWLESRKNKDIVKEK